MNLRKITVIAVFLLIAVISFTRLSPWASDPENHSYSIVKTDDKISTVMALSGGAAATSATLSLLPGDFGTPIAEQMAELAKYFMMILSALYLEKFLITISGFITFSVLIPIACILVCVAVVIKRRDLIEIAVKIAIVGFIIFLIVPASVMISDMVYDTQAQTVESTLSQYNELEIEGDSDSGLLNEITTITTDTVDRVSSFLQGLLESLAVMIVTACAIPIIVFVFLIWLVKTIFGVSPIK